MKVNEDRLRDVTIVEMFTDECLDVLIEGENLGYTNRYIFTVNGKEKANYDYFDSDNPEQLARNLFNGFVSGWLYSKKDLNWHRQLW